MKKRSFMRIMAMIFATCMMFGNLSTVFAEEVKMNEMRSSSEENQEEGIERLYGSNRYETSYAIASALKEQLGGESFDTVILANGSNFPDALAGSYLASVKDAPILMAREKYKDSLYEFIKNNLTSDGTIYVLGGNGAVPESVLSGLSGYNVKRLSGQTRYETNLLILEEAGVANEDILVCTGNAFADSLSASAVGKPILLLNNKKITEEQKVFLEEHVGNKYYIIGGTGAVNQEMEDEIAKYGTVERVYGSTRYETSIAVAEKFFDNPENAVLAYAKNFPDGLCGGPFANRMNAPLILTAEKKDDVAEDYMNENNIRSGKALGGEGVLPDRTVQNIFGYVGNILKENYNQAVNYLKEAENYLREDDIERGIEYLQKVYAITKDQTIIHFIERLEEGGYNTAGIELRLGRAKIVDLYGPKGEHYAHYENTYDTLGHLVRIESGNQGYEWYDQFVYDVNGNHIKTESYANDYVGGDYKLLEWCENEYDTEGRCIKEKRYAKNYWTNEYEVRSYYLNYYDEFANITGVDFYSNEMASYYDITIPRSQRRYEYDAEGKLVLEEVYYYKSKNPDIETYFVYDQEGRCMESRERSTDSTTYGNIQKYIYGHSKNYVINESWYDQERNGYDVYTYDETSLYIVMNSHNNFTGYYVRM